MKNVIAAAVLSLAALPVNAGGNFDDSEMLAAGVLGAIIGGHIVRNRQPNVVYTAPQPVYTEYREYYPETRYYHEYRRPMYRSVDVWIPECGCYRTIRVRVD